MTNKKCPFCEKQGEGREYILALIMEKVTVSIDYLVCDLHLHPAPLQYYNIYIMITKTLGYVPPRQIYYHVRPYPAINPGIHAIKQRERRLENNE